MRADVDRARTDDERDQQGQPPVSTVQVRQCGERERCPRGGVARWVDADHAADDHVGVRPHREGGPRVDDRFPTFASPYPKRPDASMTAAIRKRRKTIATIAVTYLAGSPECGQPHDRSSWNLKRSSTKSYARARKSESEPGGEHG